MDFHPSERWLIRNPRPIEQYLLTHHLHRHQFAAMANIPTRRLSEALRARICLTPTRLRRIASLLVIPDAQTDLDRVVLQLVLPPEYPLMPQEQAAGLQPMVQSLQQLIDALR